MKFVSFNINGLRARPHQLAAIIEQHQPDVIGLQETKVHDDMFPLEEVSQHGYHVFYHGQKGHYGVALLTKAEPLAVRRGFPTDEEDAQRRIIMADLATPQGTLTVINGYFPQGESRDHPIKFPAKTRFYQDLQNYLEQQLSAESPVLIMGDMNISPSDYDIGIGEDNRKRWLRTGKCSFLPEEREWMDRLLNWGLVDTYRHANPGRNDEFSWFDYRSKGFDDNRGLRIDLLLASTRWLRAASPPASITKPAAWRNLPTMRRSGRNLRCNPITPALAGVLLCEANENYRRGSRHSGTEWPHFAGPARRRQRSGRSVGVSRRQG
ncbi:exodeoxyribonuclease III [Serratia marcescens subsp. marcescens ATCC 13880]|nr:exodeoxyribonuclease III [Serratia marcescens subsp. marcescens ATCC 13880]